jgi:hypothetical protein
LSARLKQLGREPILPKAVLLTSCDKAATAGLKELIEADFRVICNYTVKF